MFSFNLIPKSKPKPSVTGISNSPQRKKQFDEKTLPDILTENSKPKPKPKNLAKQSTAIRLALPLVGSEDNSSAFKHEGTPLEQF